VSVTEFGAAIDGVTDDTEAIREAIADAPDGGTVKLPAGDIKISALDRENQPGSTTNPALTVEENEMGVTLSGMGPGPSGTRLFMEGGHAENHVGFEITGGS
jgi:hypothetical protein